MSEKERIRRSMSKFVLLKAWGIVRGTGICISQALEIAWKLIRSQIHIQATKVHGVSFENRQSILKKAAMTNPAYYRVRCIREAHNPHDPNAIAIYIITLNGQSYKVGYISKERAVTLAWAMDAGRNLFVLRHEITGTQYESGHLGMNLEFIVV